jgi:hypothetical protein
MKNEKQLLKKEDRLEIMINYCVNMICSECIFNNGSQDENDCDLTVLLKVRQPISLNLEKIDEAIMKIKKEEECKRLEEEKFCRIYESLKKANNQ